MKANSQVRQIILRVIKKIIKGYHPQKSILFGSYAYGHPHKDSDIDLLIIKETKERPIDLRIAVAKIISDRKRFLPVELLVLTPREVSECIKKGDQFIQEILNKGEVLYESR